MSEFNPEVQEVLNIIPQTDKKEIHITKIVNKGTEYIDLRGYYLDKTTGNFLPGKGIWIPIDLVDEVAEQLLNATCPPTLRKSLDTESLEEEVYEYED